MSFSRPIGFEYWFTVFTPTYNRAHLLSPLYESLQEQTCSDFEWIIVDDGSTDQTEQLVATWMAAAPFPVVYLRQPQNSGKPAAINRGVQEARGYFFGTLDDDDRLVPNALETCLRVWHSIPEHRRAEFYGVFGLTADASGRLISSRLPAGVIDTDAIEIAMTHRAKGDFWGVEPTSVMREFPFPADRFVPESLIWNRMAMKYRQRFVNQVLQIKQYQAGGLTDRMDVNRARSPRGSAQVYRELLAARRPMKLDLKLRQYVNFVRFSLHARAPMSEQLTSVPSAGLWLLCWPLGFALFLRDRRLLRGNER